MNKLPEKWCIKVTKESQKIVGKWIMKHDYQDGIDDLASHSSYLGYYFAYPRMEGYSVVRYKNKHTEITFEQFKKYVLKEDKSKKTTTKSKTMKPQSFQIKSSSSALLKVWFEEAAAFGYKLSRNSDKNFTGVKELCQNFRPAENIEEYKELTNIATTNTGETFVLPQQYDEALEFVREQLNPKYWIDEEEFKIGDWVVITNSGGGTNQKDIGLVCRVVDNKSKKARYPRYTIEIDRDKIGNSDRYLSPKYIRKATPEEIRKAQTVEIFDYEVKATPTLIKVGCKTIPKSVVNLFFKSLDELSRCGITLNDLVEKVGDKGLTTDKIQKIKQLL